MAMTGVCAERCWSRIGVVPVCLQCISLFCVHDLLGLLRVNKLSVKRGDKQSHLPSRRHAWRLRRDAHDTTFNDNIRDEGCFCGGELLSLLPLSQRPEQTSDDC